MKKLLLLIICLIIALFVFTLPAYALEIEKEQAEALGVDDISKNAPVSEEIFKDLDVDNALETERWIKELKDYISENLFGFVKSGLKSAVSVFFVSVLCGILMSIKTADGEFDYISLVAIFAVTAISAGSVDSFIKLAYTASDDINTLSKAVLPTLTAAAISGGAVTSAPIKLSICAMFMDATISIGQKVVFPLIYAYFALSIAGCAFRNGLLKIADMIKSVIKTILTIVCLVFTAYLSVSGIVADSADAVTAKAAKTVISTMLPVVGSMISDAASTVVSGVSVIRNAVGIFGILIVCSICLIPFLKLGVNYILFKFSAVLSECITDGKVSKMIDCTAGVYSLVLGVLGTEAIMLFFSLISLIKAVTV